MLRVDGHIAVVAALLLLLGITVTAISEAEAANIPEKSSTDVYYKSVLISDRVKLIRKELKIDMPWPSRTVVGEKLPRHVMQKALEILEKLNRLRLIKGVGEIAVPIFPAKEILPSDVYQMIVRIEDELGIIFPESYVGVNSQIPASQEVKAPTDVYQILWETSNALNTVLGLRGYSPNDVYALSERIVQEVNFLRVTQNLKPDGVTRPKRTEGKHPNHALNATYDLLKVIAIAEEDLWLRPVVVPSVVSRRIEPYEVYDALQIVLAELQFIKHRLGVERTFQTSTVVQSKTPDDVIEAINYAIKLMPSFENYLTLRQFDQTSLKKTPNHVYSSAMHVLKEVERLRAAKGIQVFPEKAEKVTGMMPRHVYGKAVEVLRKLNKLRTQSSLAPMSLPRVPLREITSTEVYGLVVRLYREIEKVFETIALEADPWESQLLISMSEEKTPNDAFEVLWSVSNMLDVVLGQNKSSLDDCVVVLRNIRSEVELIAEYRGRIVNIPALDTTPLLTDRVLSEEVNDVLQLIFGLHNKAGIIETQRPDFFSVGVHKVNGLMNKLVIILAEVNKLKLHLGGEESLSPTPHKQAHIEMMDAYKELFAIKYILRQLQ